ncbi:MAG: type IX secretion system membrane protein PorP/SprF [Bacteroidales bacterium]|nr:type IX secretion system membrane protein PorP/SprF [Bacteroidales bacterium]
MKILKYLILILFLTTSSLSKSQELYSYLLNDFAENNPAGLSTINNYQLTLKAYGYNFEDGFIRAIVPIRKIQSRIGLSAEYYGYYDNELNDVKYNLSYSYSYLFSEKSYLAIGVKASLYRLRKAYSILISNYLIEGDFKSDKFNFDVGIWFQNNNLGIGLSYNHINSPEHIGRYYYHSYKAVNIYKYEPEFNLMINHELKISDRLKMKNNLFLYDIMYLHERQEISINNIFSLNNTFSFGVTWDYFNYLKKELNLGFVMGFNLKDRYNIMFIDRFYEFESNKSFRNPTKRIHPGFECLFTVNI